MHDLDNNTVKTLKVVTDGTLPMWRTIGNGLNFEAVCKNPNCKAYNKKIWIIAGFGKFFVSELFYEL